MSRSRIPPSVSRPIDPTGLPAHELDGWAFAELAGVVEDWPTAARRVERARAGLGGRPGVASADDLEFTADLLARTLEADLGLSMVDVVRVLDRLGLPTDGVPIVPREEPEALDDELVGTAGLRNAA